MTATIRRAETALTDRRDSLYARLEEGYGRIVRGIDEGADIATWENLWLALLDEYNAVCDELQAALCEPVTDPNHCEDWIANQQLHDPFLDTAWDCPE